MGWGGYAAHPKVEHVVIQYEHSQKLCRQLGLSRMVPMLKRGHDLTTLLTPAKKRQLGYRVQDREGLLRFDQKERGQRTHDRPVKKYMIGFVFSSSFKLWGAQHAKVVTL